MTERVTHDALDHDRRLARERRKSERLVDGGDPIRRLAQRLLGVSGLRGAGRRRALALQLETHRLSLVRLPDAFHGLRMLQISDPHYPERRDVERETGIATLAAATPHDIAVLTGDYRDRSFGPFDGALAALEALRPSLAERAFAVLGNHDPLALVEPMRALGYEVLLNAHALLDRDGARLAIAGIDDPSYYGTDDLSKALPADDMKAATVLLAHAPDRHAEAARAGVDAYLCGHTHGGQICLPGGIALRRNSPVAAGLIQGRWRDGGMTGYTSRGAGTSIVDARFFCPPELTLHVLEARHASDGTGSVT